MKHTEKFLKCMDERYRIFLYQAFHLYLKLLAKVSLGGCRDVPSPRALVDRVFAKTDFSKLA